MEMHNKLRKIITEKDIKIILDDDNLDIEVPASMPDQEASKISKQVLIIDRILNDKIKEYDELAKQDRDINGGKITKTTNIYRDACREFHKGIYRDKED